MKCKKVKNMILTDYSDKEIKATQKELIEEHLAQCRACREFASMVTKSVIGPFRKIETKEPLDSIWYRIKEKIEAETQQETRPYPTHNLMDKLRNFIYIPKPIFAVATAMVLVLCLGIFTKFYSSKQEIVNMQSREQVEYLAYLFTENSYGSNGENVDYNTAIEEYFL
ncbi:zf-HC2 domain-containing protein [Candidatus Omnitrophota bacterium]